MARAVLLQTSNSFVIIIIIIIAVIIIMAVIVNIIIIIITFKARSMTRLVRLSDKTSEEEDALDTTSRAV